MLMTAANRESSILLFEVELSRVQRAANEAWLIKKIATNNETHADQTYAPHMHVPHTNQSNCMFFVSFCQWHCKQSKLDELLDVRQRHLLCYICICAVCSVSMFLVFVWVTGFECMRLLQWCWYAEWLYSLTKTVNQVKAWGLYV